VTDAPYVDVLEIAVGVVLVCALIVVWRRDALACVAALRMQGVALGVVVATLAVHTHDTALAAVAVIVVLAKVVVMPELLHRVVRRDPASREQSPRINVPASLVMAGALIVLAYVTSTRLTALAPTTTTNLVPIATATVLVGFLVLVTRRKAVSQIVGLLLIDNGVALAAFLLTSGVPFVVELGVSLDVLLIVVVLRVLAAAMHRALGSVDLDQLRELHD
jgi:hydrogenase-4 component E